MKKNLLKTMYQFGAFAPFRWASRNKVLILTYHRFSRGQETAKISAEEFGAHLDYLKTHNRVLRLDETIECLIEGKSLPPNATVITIDDGYNDAYDIAFPLLKQFGLPATVYAITDFVDQKIWLWTDLMRYVLLNTKMEMVEVNFGSTDTIAVRLNGDLGRLDTANRINSRLKKLSNDEKESKIREIGNELGVVIPDLPPLIYQAMTWDQVSEMDRENVQVESHTVTHPILPNVDQRALEFEMQSSKKRLEDVLGRPVGHFCYPNGSLDENVSEAAKNAGYLSAVTTAYGFNDVGTNRFLMNRIDAQPALEGFAQSASGFEAVRQGMFK